MPYDQGADVVFAAAGKSGLGAIDETRRSGVYASGVDSNQDAPARRPHAASSRCAVIFGRWSDRNSCCNAAAFQVS